jgi:hypothetical protein
MVAAMKLASPPTVSPFGNLSMSRTFSVQVGNSGSGNPKHQY